MKNNKRKQYFWRFAYEIAHLFSGQKDSIRVHLCSSVVRLIGMFCLVFFWVGNVRAAQLTMKDLQNDLSYYERVSRRENLNANDRLYILYRLENKYFKRGLDLSSLQKEIQLWEKERSNPSQKSLTTDKTQVPVGQESVSVQNAAPELRRILVHDETAVLNVKMKVTGRVVPEAFQIQDPEKPKQFLLAVDFPGVRDKLWKRERKMFFDEGPLISLAVFEARQDKLRVYLEMRGKRAYRVVRAENEVSVEIEKTKKEIKAGEGKRLRVQPPVEQKTPKAETVSEKPVKQKSAEKKQEPLKKAEQKKPSKPAEPDWDLPPLPKKPVVAVPAVADKKPVAKKPKAKKKKPEKPRVVKREPAGPKRTRVSITGRIRKPGGYKYKKGYTLTQLVADAGGVFKNAKTKFVKIYRQKDLKSKVLRVNLAHILDGHKEKDVKLRPGDIVMIP